MRKKSSFRMENEFNGYGEKTYLKASERKTYVPLPQGEVRLTPDFSELIPKMLGIIPVANDPKSANNIIIMKSLGGVAIANQVVLKKGGASGEYIPHVQVASRGLTTGSYLQNRTYGSEVIIINPGIQPGWEKQENGGWKYINESGSYIKGDWKLHNGKWYYLNTDEHMVTGWKKIAGKWYYFKLGQENGYMVLGWRKIEDKWFYFKEEGKAGYMALGWRKIENKWYYFKEEGEAGYMVTGWREIKGKWYYFEEGGSMAVSKWITDGGTGKKYWVDESGVWDEEKDGAINEKIDRFVEIALNQHISKTNFRENQITKDGKLVGDNKTIYGDWYGMNGQPWCAMFVSWCANEAGILGEIVPKYASCLGGGQPWYKQEKKLWSQTSGYKPKKGDVFFQKRSGGGHTGIVVAYVPDKKRVYTIEGNKDDAVRAYVSKLSSKKFGEGFGMNGGSKFGIVPDNINFIDEEGEFDNMS